tara:strand:+ start:55 stop:228 length:174 start_codon:yes stop_codon:yes gene_type:complete
MTKKEDRLTEYSRDRLNEMIERISESRNPEEITSILKCEIKIMVDDYDLTLARGVGN